jgi:hypothetical protein
MVAQNKEHLVGDFLCFSFSFKKTVDFFVFLFSLCHLISTYVYVERRKIADGLYDPNCATIIILALFKVLSLGIAWITAYQASMMSTSLSAPRTPSPSKNRAPLFPPNTPVPKDKQRLYTAVSTYRMVWSE